jgi:hypothetical protein
MENLLFRSAQLKIDRADHHIKELIGVINTFPQTGLHHAGIEEDLKTARTSLKIEVTDEILDKVALIIGDAAHNLRTALDHVACELVTRFGGTPDTSTRFPFGKTREKTVTICKRVMQRVHPNVITCIVQDIQPYKGGNNALYALHTLDIIDKHRLVVPIFPTVGVKVAMKGDDGSVDYLAFIIARGEETDMVHPPSGSQVESYSNLMLHILFDDVEGFERRPVVKTLYEVRQIVLAVMYEIERTYLSVTK